MNSTPEIEAAANLVESLLSGFKDAEARDRAQELVRNLMNLYGQALENILAIVRESGNSAAWIQDRLADDRLVASLLLVHGLHPVSTETRVRRALSRIERFLEGHRLFLDALDGSTANVRAEPMNGNGPAPATLAHNIEQAVRQAAPEVERVEITGVASPALLVQIATAQGN